LLVKAKGYATQAFTITVPGPPRDFAIDSGAEWSGGLFDPEGVLIDVCSMKLFHANHMIDVESACSPEGFSFHNVPAGDYELHVHIGKRWWSGEDGRNLMVPVQILQGERRREDVRWPAGLDVSGFLVDEANVPVPDAYLEIGGD
jgi:hypothetical protein